MPEILPCKDCQTACKAIMGRYQGRCVPCRDKRRAEGTNILAYNCECGKQVLLQAKRVPSWDGLCPECRYADKISKGATVETRYQNGRPYNVALFEHELPKDRYDREVL